MAYGTKQEVAFAETLAGLMEDEFGARVRTYEDAGILTMNEGLVVKFDDGREFQVTVVQSGGARTDEEEEDDDE